MKNNLQVVLYKNYLSPQQIKVEKTDIKNMAITMNALMIFMNNDNFMGDVVNDMNKDNPCTCGNRKFVLNKNRKKTSFLRY